MGLKIIYFPEYGDFKGMGASGQKSKKEYEKALTFY